MRYEILILRRAQKELADLPKPDYARVRDAVAELAENPRPSGCKNWWGAKAGVFVRETIASSTK